MWIIAIAKNFAKMLQMWMSTPVSTELNYMGHWAPPPTMTLQDITCITDQWGPTQTEMGSSEKTLFEHLQFCQRMALLASHGKGKLLTLHFFLNCGCKARYCIWRSRNKPHGLFVSSTPSSWLHWKPSSVINKWVLQSNLRKSDTHWGNPCHVYTDGWWTRKRFWRERGTHTENQGRSAEARLHYGLLKEMRTRKGSARLGSRNMKATLRVGELPSCRPALLAGASSVQGRLEYSQNWNPKDLQGPNTKGLQADAWIPAKTSYDRLKPEGRGGEKFWKSSEKWQAIHCLKEPESACTSTLFTQMQLGFLWAFLQQALPYLKTPFVFAMLLGWPSRS